MKEFKRVGQNDLLLEFLKWFDENVWVDINKIEATRYHEYDNSALYKVKEIFIELNGDEYYINLFYNGVEMNTTLNISQTKYDDVELLYEQVFKETK